MLVERSCREIQGDICVRGTLKGCREGKREKNGRGMGKEIGKKLLRNERM